VLHILALLICSEYAPPAEGEPVNLQVEVVDAQGIPLKGIAIEATNGRELTSVVVSNESGQATFSSIPAGEWFVRFADACQSRFDCKTATYLSYYHDASLVMTLWAAPDDPTCGMVVYENGRRVTFLAE